MQESSSSTRERERKRCVREREREIARVAGTTGATEAGAEEVRER